MGVAFTPTILTTGAPTTNVHVVRGGQEEHFTATMQMPAGRVLRLADLLALNWEDRLGDFLGQGWEQRREHPTPVSALNAVERATALAARAA